MREDALLLIPTSAWCCAIPTCRVFPRYGLRARRRRPRNNLLQQSTPRASGVLSAHAAVAPLNWLVFVELPTAEAYAPLYRGIARSAISVVAAIVVALLAGLLLTRRMVVPIRALHDGAVQIGHGDLTQRIAIKTGDELEALGDQFNYMAARLQESYATLEHKVEERTRQLEVANLAKSRFLAAASHDLRQPLHALGLFVAQLYGRDACYERRRILARLDAALSAMNELFNALLDISKLDAGVLNPTYHRISYCETAGPSRYDLHRDRAGKRTIVAGRFQQRLGTQRLHPAGAHHFQFGFECGTLHQQWRRGRRLPQAGCQPAYRGLGYRNWSSGGSAARTSSANSVALARGDGRSGLGLGLAIVDRLCRLLDHSVSLTSILGKGSCFSIAVPLVDARLEIGESSAPAHPLIDTSDRKLVVVIDDDPLVLEAMGGLFRSWGYHLLVAGTDDEALAGVIDGDIPPDLIVSDYHLPSGKTSIDIIEGLRSAFSAKIPAFLVSGDTSPELLRQARASGYHLLHKPVDPMTLRAMVAHVLREQQIERVKKSPDPESQRVQIRLGR